jgi:hypothetical protein
LAHDGAACPFFAAGSNLQRAPARAEARSTRAEPLDSTIFD